MQKQRLFMCIGSAKYNSLWHRLLKSEDLNFLHSKNSSKWSFYITRALLEGYFSLTLSLFFFFLEEEVHRPFACLKAERSVKLLLVMDPPSSEIIIIALALLLLAQDHESLKLTIVTIYSSKEKCPLTCCCFTSTFLNMYNICMNLKRFNNWDIRFHRHLMNRNGILSLWTKRGSQ